jgi:hypothetical protein
MESRMMHLRPDTSRSNHAACAAASFPRFHAMSLAKPADAAAPRRVMNTTDGVVSITARARMRSLPTLRLVVTTWNGGQK